MFIRWDGVRTGSVASRIFIRVLLASFVLRSLIPLGYMPDLGAAANGVLKVAICAASGSKLLLLDADGKPVPDQQSHHADQPCAFAALAALALPQAVAGAAAAPDRETAAVIPPLAVDLPAIRAGPQLGSRGPPTLS